jgi:hypothetical protein
VADKVRDRYDEMSGPALAAELQDRELPLSGKVDELRDRLRADDAEEGAEPSPDGTDDVPEGAETGEEAFDLPEPRDPVEYAAGTLTLTEEQARQLTAGEAKLRQFTKHVNPMSTRKYAEGDQVLAVLVPESGYAIVLPFGIEISDSGSED